MQLKTKPLISENKKLMQEWDWEENNKLGFYPDRITEGSGKKVFWKCSKGHTWDAVVNSRVRGHNCPHCTNQAVNEENSLACRFPEIAKEWDYDKNSPFLPEQINCKSNKKYYWICPNCKESYIQSVYNRTIGNAKCIYCSKSPKTTEKYNLKTKYPDLAKEWDYEKNYPIRPEDIAPQAPKKYFWICSKGHSYSASPNNRVRGKSRCNNCNLAENNLVFKNPDLAKQWHPIKNGILTPDKVTYGSNQIVWWLCPVCGYEWEREINARLKRGCPECKKGTQTSAPEQIIFHYVKQYFSGTLNRHKINKKEIDVFIPSLKIGIEYDGEGHHNTEKSYKKDTQKNIFLKEKGVRLIRVREAKSHEMKTDLCEIYIVERVPDYSTLIPIIEDVLRKLTNTEIKIDVKEFETIKNEIKANLHILSNEESLAFFIQQQEDAGTPLKLLWDEEENNRINLFSDKVTIGSGIEAHWICIKGHKTKKEIYRVAGGEGCGRCKHKTTEEWIAEAKVVHGDKFDYSKVNFINTDTNVIIICEIHGEFSQNPTNHLSGMGCKWCAKQGGFHELETLAVKYPELAKEWDNELNKLTPNEVAITDSKNKYWWKCTNGEPHSFEALIHRRIAGMGCAVCHGKQVSWDTCLACLQPNLMNEWHESNTIDPNKVTEKSEQIAIWKCPNPDHELYKMSIAQRVIAEYGCQYCSGRKKTHKAFSLEVKEKYPNIELLSTYIDSKNRIEAKCNICGNVWTPLPPNLINTGCGNCKNKEL